VTDIHINLFKLKSLLFWNWLAVSGTIWGSVSTIQELVKFLGPFRAHYPLSRNWSPVTGPWKDYICVCWPVCVTYIIPDDRDRDSLQNIGSSLCIDTFHCPM